MPAESVGAQAADLVLFPAFVALALVGFFRKSVRLKYVTLAASVLYLGFFRSQLISIVNIFGVLSWNLPIFKYSLFWYLFAGVHRRLDGAVGTAVLRPDLRLRCADAAAGTVVPAKLRREPPPWLEQRAGVGEIRSARRRRGVLPRDPRHLDLSLRRAVLDVHAATAPAVMWIGARRCCSSRPSSSETCIAGFSVRSARSSGLLSGLTVFRIKRWSECKTLQDLREDLRVGRDSRTGDREVGMRAMR